MPTKPIGKNKIRWNWASVFSLGCSKVAICLAVCALPCAANVVLRLAFESRDILSPKQWDNTQLKRFLAHKKMDRVKLTDKHDGKVLMKMSVQQMRTQLFDDKDSELAKRLFDLLRLENDKISKLQRADRIKLAKARKGQS